MAKTIPTPADIEQCARDLLDPIAAKDYLRRARPCVVLVPHRVTDDRLIRIGQSRIGGRPDLPRDLSWPQWKGVPLEFVAQVALPDVAGVEPDMPANGWLWFFYSLTYFPGGDSKDDREGWRVLHWQGEPSALRRCDPPAFERPRQSLWQRMLVGRIGERIRTFDACSVEFGSSLSLPHEPPPGIDDEFLMEEIVGKFADGDPAGSSMFGLEYPVQRTQGDMPRECEQIWSSQHGKHIGAAAADDGTDWVLLLQLDSHPEASMMWGDAGMLYYWIRRSDLQARRFDRAWMFMECS
jgi:uncharacterized protein YwqG